MPEITAAMVKQLREETGLGMMDCKKALDEADGDLAAAKEALRAKGLATAEKKAHRTTAEGLVGIKISDDQNAAAMVEVLCETDFCARNEQFQALVAGLLDKAYDADPGEVLPSEDMTSLVKDTLAKIGENMSYARGYKIQADQVGSYLHHNHKVGVIVGIEGRLDEETLTGICQHIAFSDPMGITADDIPADVVDGERNIAKQQAIESGKPPEIAEKMVEGKIRKFFEQHALIDQDYVKDDKKKIKDLLGDAKITAFARYAIGA